MEVIKAILQNFPQGDLFGLLLNGGVILLVYLLVWKKFKRRLRHWRIQLKERVDASQIKRELKNALFTLAVGALFSSIVIYLNTQEYTKIYLNFSDITHFTASLGSLSCWSLMTLGSTGATVCCITPAYSSTYT